MLSISERKGNRTVAPDIDGKPLQPTKIPSPEAKRRARGCKPRFACPKGQAAPVRAHERRGPIRGRSPRKGAQAGRGTPRRSEIYTPQGGQQM